MSNLYNNPLIESAKKAMTPEQLDEYKRMGEYMYNNIDYKTAAVGSTIRQSKDEDFIFYAVESLKSGGDPNDLTEDEIQALCKIYGGNWYERFGFKDDEVPKPKLSLTTAEQIFAEAEQKAKNLNLSRQERRALERRMNKDRKTLQNSKI
jgi:hypothetical protein